MVIMTSQFTRTTRRTEGLSTRSSNAVVLRMPSQTGTNNRHSANIKRPRDESDQDEGNLKVKKKAKIAIEISGRSRERKGLSKTKTNTRSFVITEEDRVAAEKYAAAAAKSKQHTTEIRSEPAKSLPQSQSIPAKKSTIHHEKVANGIKHELDRLQPIAADLKNEKRKLRSQEGARFKSELSAYFPDYDEVIGNDPKEEHILNFDTPLSWPIPRKAALRKPDDLTDRFALKHDPDSLFTDMNNCHKIDSSVLSGVEGEEDTLTDEYFERTHRKPERQERSVRNSDKSKAQHERDQVIRLMEGLQGHDWLKLMGVSGITASKKKEYEPAREHFIKGCEAIIAKFKMWKDEEKRRKLEKEAARAEARESEGAEDADEQGKAAGEEEDQAMDEDEGDISDGDPPDYSDVDASAARQLHEEAIARSAPTSKNGRGRPKAAPVPQPVQEVEKPFTSFFKKPYLREAALGKHRRSGRKGASWGFGQPVPDVEKQDFDLPVEYRDEETLKIHARRKRRDRRVSKT